MVTARCQIELTHKALLEVLHYDPETGVCTWLKTVSSKAVKGSKAGHIWNGGSNGPYRQIGLFGKNYRAARLIFFYITGEWPSCEIDHEDLDGLNNRWENLRLASGTQNQGNKGLPSNNTSGFKGVSFDKRTGRWVAYIGINGRNKNLGRFDSVDDACDAYRIAAQKHFGDFARTAP